MDDLVIDLQPSPTYIEHTVVDIMLIYHGQDELSIVSTSGAVIPHLSKPHTKIFKIPIESLTVHAENLDTEDFDHDSTI